MRWQKQMYTQLSAPKLHEQLNGNIHYQMYCGVSIDPESPLTNYKLIDDIIGGRRVEDTAVTGHTCKGVEAVHEGP